MLTAISPTEIDTFLTGESFNLGTMRPWVAVGLLILTIGTVGCSAGPSVAGSSRTPAISPVAASPLAPSFAASPPASNALHLQGPRTTDSSHEIVGSGEGCGFGPPLIFQTNAMTLPNEHVVRVAFTIGAQASSPASYSATSPLQEYGYTPLTMGEANNSTVGAGNRINATSGRVTVDGADAAKGLFYGTVDAHFADSTYLTGTWVCRVGE
jgi:hypothetical protein